ncbi:MAG: autotransporter outer membrane beta-barrel domain-containing protein [Alphaproteobacteria bacterium]
MLVFTSAASWLALLSPAHAVPKTWNDGTDSWLTGTDWTPAGAPTVNDDAAINNAGTAQVNAGTATFKTLSLGAAAGNSGNLAIGSGGIVNGSGSGYMYVGNGGTGTLAITSGGTYNMGTGHIYLGQGATGNGTLTMTGGSIAGYGTLVVGGAGTGLANISAGASMRPGALYVGYAAGGTGTVNAVGTGGTPGAAGNTIISGVANIGQSGTATVTLTNGALGSFGTTNISAGAGSHGTVNVLSGSRMGAGDPITVGGSATSNGTILVSGTGSSLAPGYSFLMAAGNNTATITANATGTFSGGNNNGLVIGTGAGANDIFNVTAGGKATVNTTYGLVAGVNGGLGTINVDGTNSLLSTSNSTPAVIGQSGTGALNVTGGGATTYGTSTFTIGNNAGSTGTVTVDGTGSKITGNGEMIVGNSGTGTLTLTNNATGSIGSLSASANISGSGIGTVNVGTGAVLTSTGNSYIGRNGTGSLAVTGGGTFNSGALGVGYGVGGNGTATVDGAGSLLKVTGNSFVGDDGVGVLTLSNGASANLADVIVSGHPGSAGTVNLGAGTTFAFNNMDLNDIGTLNVGNGAGAVANVTGNRIAGTSIAASINIDQAGTATFNPTMTGQLALNQLGSGTTILTGDSDFTGPTTISAGTLQLGNGGTTGSLINSDILDNSHLVFNRSGTFYLSGNITGGGDVTQAGPGTIIVTGENAYTGGTIISGGTLQVGDGGSTGNLTGPITNDSHLVLDRGDHYEFGGVITGSGDLTKTGGGLTKIMNSQAYTGATHVEDGELRANAANILGTTSGLTVDPGAIFSANGYDQNMGTLVNNGIVNMFGIGPDANLTVSTLTGSGTFGLTTNLAAGSGDHIAVSGASSGAHFLTILNSGGAPASLADTLELVSTTDSSTGGATFRQLGNGVDVGVYNYTVQQGNGSAGLPDVNDWYLALSPGSRSEVVKDIIGTAASMSNSWFTQMDNLHRRMGKQRLTDPSAEPYDVWVRGYSREVDVDASVTGRAFTENVSGLDVGADHVLAHGGGDTLIGGVFAGYGRSDRDFNDYGSKGDTNTPYAGLYATWFNANKYYLDLTAKLQYFDNSFDAADASGNTHHGDYDQWGYGGSAEIGKRFDIGSDGWILQPQAQLQYVQLTGEDYTTQLGSDIHVATDNIYQGRVGLELGKIIPRDGGGMLYPYGRVSVVEQVSSGGDIHADTLNFNGSLDGASLEYGVGTIYQIDPVHQAYVALTASQGQRYDQRWGVNAGLRYEF